jgi:hypothetical protein
MPTSIHQLERCQQWNEVAPVPSVDAEMPVGRKNLAMSGQFGHPH